MGIKFDYDNMRLGVQVTDCRDAIQKASDILIEKGCILQGYVDEMFAAFDELGPYFVLSPGMAFAHSRPSENVKQTALSVITLDSPVCFGSESNDPVWLVCVIASVDAQEHIDLLMRLASFLNNKEHVEAIRAARSEEEKRAIVDELNEGGF